MHRQTSTSCNTHALCNNMGLMHCDVLHLLKWHAVPCALVRGGGLIWAVMNREILFAVLTVSVNVLTTLSRLWALQAMFLCTLVYITVGVCGYTAFKDRFVSNNQRKCTRWLQDVPLRLQVHPQTCLTYLRVFLASITSIVAICQFRSHSL